MPQIAGAKRFHRGAFCCCSSCCCCSCCCCGGDDACGHYYWEGWRSKHGLLFLSLKWNKAGALESYDDGDVSRLISILQQGLLQLCPFWRILETFTQTAEAPRCIVYRILEPFPRKSMGLVHLPTWMVDLYNKQDMPWNYPHPATVTTRVISIFCRESL